MKYLHLIWASLFRSKTRTLLTLLSVVTAFLLFGILDSVSVAFNSSAKVAGRNAKLPPTAKACARDGAWPAHIISVARPSP